MALHGKCCGRSDYEYFSVFFVDLQSNCLIPDWGFIFAIKVKY